MPEIVAAKMMAHLQKLSIDVHQLLLFVYSAICDSKSLQIVSDTFSRKFIIRLNPLQQKLCVPDCAFCFWRWKPLLSTKKIITTNWSVSKIRIMFTYVEQNKCFSKCWNKPTSSCRKTENALGVPKTRIQRIKYTEN